MRGALSADGRFATFESGAGNLVPGDTNGRIDVFMHDRQTGATERLSVSTSGVQGIDGQSQDAAISAAGRVVAFDSTASSLVPRDTNHSLDVFVRDLMQPAPELASLSPASGITGTKFIINGAYFNDATNVTLNGKAAKFRLRSPNRIEATVPDRATTGKVAVTTSVGTATSQDDYVVTFSVITLTPGRGPVGTNVTLAGIGFGDVTSVKFNGTPAAFTVLSPTAIRATVPAGATTGKVSATSPKGTVRGPKFTVTS